MFSSVKLGRFWGSEWIKTFVLWLRIKLGIGSQIQLLEFGLVFGNGECIMKVPTKIEVQLCGYEQSVSALRAHEHLNHASY